MEFITASQGLPLQQWQHVRAIWLRHERRRSESHSLMTLCKLWIWCELLIDLLVLSSSKKDMPLAAIWPHWTPTSCLSVMSWPYAAAVPCWQLSPGGTCSALSRMEISCASDMAVLRLTGVSPRQSTSQIFKTSNLGKSIETFETWIR